MHTSTKSKYFFKRKELKLRAKVELVEHSLNKIRSSKFFRYWQLYNQTKKLFKKPFIHSKLSNKSKSQEEIKSTKQHLANLNIQYREITKSKAFNLWQKYNLFKKIFFYFFKKPKKNLKIITNLFTNPKEIIFKIKNDFYSEKENECKIEKFYSLWNYQYFPSKKQLEKQKEKSLLFKYRPKISIITPVYNPKDQFLEDCIQSVINQTYDNWELCLADDASTNKNTKSIINKFLEKDNRIKCVFRKKNGHICKASNSALKISTGQYIALLDNDDLLPANALYEVVKTINLHPKSDFLYSDEDKLSENNIDLVNPHFKTGWSLDKLFSFMYIGHLSVYKHDILKKVKGFTINTQGAQDYDLLLKSLPYISHIEHISKILYHWRKHPESTSMSLKSKPYALEAGKNVLQNRLSNFIDGNFQIIDTQKGVYQIDFNGNKKPTVDIYLHHSLRNIFKIEKIIGSFCNIKKTRYFKNAKEINEFNKKDDSSIILIINEIIDIKNKQPLINFFNYLVHVKNVGIIGPKLVNSEDKIISSGLIINHNKIKTAFLNQYNYYGYNNNLFTQSNVTSVDPAFFAINRKLFNENIGMFDENVKELHSLNLSLKFLSKKIRTVFFPQLTINIKSSRKNTKKYKKDFLYIKKIYPDILKTDIFFNSNLDLNNKNEIILKY